MSELLTFPPSAFIPCLSHSQGCVSQINLVCAITCIHTSCFKIHAMLDTALVVRMSQWLSWNTFLSCPTEMGFLAETKDSAMAGLVQSTFRHVSKISSHGRWLWIRAWAWTIGIWIQITALWWKKSSWGILHAIIKTVNTLTHGPKPFHLISHFILLTIQRSVVLQENCLVSTHPSACLLVSLFVCFSNF